MLASNSLLTYKHVLLQTEPWIQITFFPVHSSKNEPVFPLFCFFFSKIYNEASGRTMQLPSSRIWFTCQQLRLNPEYLCIYIDSDSMSTHEIFPSTRKSVNDGRKNRCVHSLSGCPTQVQERLLACRQWPGDSLFTPSLFPPIQSAWVGNHHQFSDLSFGILHEVAPSIELLQDPCFYFWAWISSLLCFDMLQICSFSSESGRGPGSSIDGPPSKSLLMSSCRMLHQLTESNWYLHKIRQFNRSYLGKMFYACLGSSPIWIKPCSCCWLEYFVFLFRFPVVEC